MKEEHIELIRQQISQIDGLLELHDEDMKFQKWYQRTSMILEETPGAKHEEVEDFKDITYTEMRVRMVGEPRPSEEDLVAYRKGLQRARLLLEGIVDRYELFEKPKQPRKMDDETIRTKIMEAAYQQYKRGGFTDPVRIRDLSDQLGLSRVDYDRNEEYLPKKGFIKYFAGGSLVITEDGIDLMEHPHRSEQEGTFGIHLSDVHAPVSIVIGNLNSSIANMEERGISELPAILKELTQIIQSSKLGDDDKIEAIENLDTVTDQANKTKPNKNVVNAALDTIFDKAGKISGAIALLEQVGKWFKVVAIS